MAIHPPDQSNEFVESGMRLITSPSSDRLLAKSRKKFDECTAELWDPSTGPQEPSEMCDN